MNVWHGIDAWPEGREPVVATIGNFDGVHAGHRAILRSVADDAARRGARAALITFEPHPLAVIAPSRRPPRIQTLRQRLLALESAGLHDVLVLEFDRRLAELGPEAFFRETLLPRVRLHAVHVGRSFRFGRGRLGDLESLREIGRGEGFEVFGVPQVRIDGEVVSSTAIRKAVSDGEVDRARIFLGRPFALEGIVVRGDGRGKDLGVPTANLAHENELVPRRGVYVADVTALGSRVPAVANVGVRPTFDGSALTVEAHLLDWDGDLYGERIEIGFLARLRDEKAFPSAEALLDQIARDRAAAAAWVQSQAALP